MGRVRTEKPSERKRRANQANARKPRGRWAGTPERELLEEAKRRLREAIPDGAERLGAMIRDPTTPAELFLAAFKVAADRAGLPAQAQVQAGVNVGRALLKAPDWLGWPGMEPELGQEPTPLAGGSETES